jgi:hypothetical protein
MIGCLFVVCEKVKKCQSEDLICGKVTVFNFVKNNNGITFKVRNQYETI